jgi:succinoglycan biosynthesis transport protein ExoP
MMCFTWVKVCFEGNAMTPRQLLLVFRARYKAVLFLFFITFSVALAISLQLPVRYVAAASVLVDIRASDPLTAMIMPGSLATQADIISSDRVARKVIKALNIDEDPAKKQLWLDGANRGRTIEDWFVDLLQKDRPSPQRGTLEEWLISMLQKNLMVTPSRESNVITIAFRGGNPDFTAAVANAYAQAYIDTVIEMKVEPAKQYATWFESQAKVLRENVEVAQARLSRYQQSKGIVERQEQLDYETA